MSRRILSDKVNIGKAIVLEFPSHEPDALEEETIEIEPEVEMIQPEHVAILKEEAIQIIEDAKKLAKLHQDNAQVEIDALKNQAQDSLTEADKTIEEAKLKAQEIIEQANQEAIEIKEKASQEGAKEGYEAGYKDGEEKIAQELKQKVQEIDDFAQNTYEMKNKVLKSTKREMVELVLAVSKKLCIESVDESALALLIDKSIKMLSEKENIELIVSHKYANLLNNLFNGSINAPDLENIDIDKLRNLKLSYSSGVSEDSIIIQTSKDRLDLSIETQLNEISRAFEMQLESDLVKNTEEE